MRVLDETGVTLLWRARGLFSRTYDLVRADEEIADAEPFATLAWREAFLLGRSRGELTAAGGTWRFVPEGAFGRHLCLFGADGAARGTYRRAWRGGTLELADGRAFHWHRVHWLRRMWALDDADGAEALRFAIRFSLFNPRVTVEIASTVASADRALLAGFGFFLVRRAVAAGRRAAA
jgi:hypothetical protein